MVAISGKKLRTHEESEESDQEDQSLAELSVNIRRFWDVQDELKKGFVSL